MESNLVNLHSITPNFENFFCDKDLLLGIWKFAKYENIDYPLSTTICIFNADGSYFGYGLAEGKGLFSCDGNYINCYLENSLNWIYKFESLTKDEATFDLKLLHPIVLRNTTKDFNMRLTMVKIGENFH